MLYSLLRWLSAASLVSCLSGCAALRVTITPDEPIAVCQAQATALVLWAPQWRSDQKDVPQREQAAETGIQTFLRSSGCFASYTLRRAPQLTAAAVRTEVADTQVDRVLTLQVRELGPVLKLFASPALVDGGTEVVVEVGAYQAPHFEAPQIRTIHWEHGGPGVIKGVETLAQDMQAALKAGLQPS
jgi:hypothetical protein